MDPKVNIGMWRGFGNIGEVSQFVARVQCLMLIRIDVEALVHIPNRTSVFGIVEIGQIVRDHD